MDLNTARNLGIGCRVWVCDPANRMIIKRYVWGIVAVNRGKRIDISHVSDMNNPGTPLVLEHEMVYATEASALRVLEKILFNRVQKAQNELRKCQERISAL